MATAVVFDRSAPTLQPASCSVGAQHHAGSPMLRKCKAELCKCAFSGRPGSPHGACPWDTFLSSALGPPGLAQPRSRPQLCPSPRARCGGGDSRREIRADSRALSPGGEGGGVCASSGAPRCWVQRGGERGHGATSPGQPVLPPATRPPSPLQPNSSLRITNRQLE